MFFFIDYLLSEMPLDPRLAIILHGAFVDENTNTDYFLKVQVQLLHTNAPINDNNTDAESIIAINDNNILRIPIYNDIENIDFAPEVKKSHTFDLSSEFWSQLPDKETILRLRIFSNLPISIPISIAYDATPIDKSLGVIYAAIVLLGLYVMIIWEVVHRTFAAMLASTMSIALLAYMNERPTMPDIMSWIDVETLLLLFGMMILVAIMSETGIFDYLAVYAFKVR